MIDEVPIRLSINTLSPSVTCVSVPACSARLITPKAASVHRYRSTFGRGHKVIIIHYLLEGQSQGICVKAFTYHLLSRLNLCLTLFSGKTPPLITGCCTPLIGRWKRGFGFQGWWPPIHVEPSRLASMEMHYNHPVRVCRSSRFSASLEDSLCNHVCVCVWGQRDLKWQWTFPSVAHAPAVK